MTKTEKFFVVIAALMMGALVWTVIHVSKMAENMGDISTRLEKVEVTSEQLVMSTNTVSDATEKVANETVTTANTLKRVELETLDAIRFGGSNYAANIRKSKNYGFVSHAANSEWNNQIKVWTHKGGKPLDADKFRETIRAVLNGLEFVPHTDEMVDLILEIGAVESNFGTYVRQHNGGPAIGVFQIEPQTWDDCTKFLGYSAKGRKFLSRVNHHRDRGQSTDFDVIDLDYNIARICAVLYWKVGDQLPDYILSREERAALWKAMYNTARGKGSISAYLKNAEKYLGPEEA